MLRRDEIWMRETEGEREGDGKREEWRKWGHREDAGGGGGGGGQRRGMKGKKGQKSKIRNKGKKTDIIAFRSLT